MNICLWFICVWPLVKWACLCSISGVQLKHCKASPSSSQVYLCVTWLSQGPKRPTRQIKPDQHMCQQRKTREGSERRHERETFCWRGKKPKEGQNRCAALCSQETRQFLLGTRHVNYAAAFFSNPECDVRQCQKDLKSIIQKITTQKSTQKQTKQCSWKSKLRNRSIIVFFWIIKGG